LFLPNEIQTGIKNGINKLEAGINICAIPTIYNSLRKYIISNPEVFKNFNENLPYEKFFTQPQGVLVSFPSWSNKKTPVFVENNNNNNKNNNNCGEIHKEKIYNNNNDNNNKNCDEIHEEKICNSDDGGGKNCDKIYNKNTKCFNYALVTEEWNPINIYCFNTLQEARETTEKWTWQLTARVLYGKCDGNDNKNNGNKDDSDKYKHKECGVIETRFNGLAVNTIIKSVGGRGGQWMFE
jgi:hypothetical protein